MSATLTEVRKTFVRVARNAASLLTSDVLNKASTFVVYALLARYTDARAFGQLALGLMLLYTFQVFACAGLPTLITREVAKRRSWSGRYFAGASIISTCASLLSFGALAILVTLSRYPNDTSEVILLLGIAILPWSLTTIADALFRAWEQMHLIALVAIPANLLKIGLSYYLLSHQHGVRSIAVVLLACHFVTLLVEWTLLFRRLGFRNIEIDFPFCRELVGRAWRFLGIDGVIAFWYSITTVILSWFASEAAVGLYGAACQLLVPAHMALKALVGSFFPMMCRRAEESRARLRRLAVLVLEISVVVAVPSCVLLYFGAGPVVAVLYGNQDFSGSVLILHILLPVLLVQTVTNTFGHVLYSQRREHLTLRIVTIDALFNLFAALVLIYSFGLIGAAVATTLTYLLDGVLHWWATRDCFLDKKGRPLSWKATMLVQIALAGGIMAGVHVVWSELNFFVTAIGSSLVYLTLLAIFVLAAQRGSMGIRERFLTPLMERRTQKPACDSYGNHATRRIAELSQNLATEYD